MNVRKELQMVESNLDDAYGQLEYYHEEEDLRGGYGHDITCLNQEILTMENIQTVLNALLELKKPIDNMTLNGEWCACARFQ